MRLLAIALLLSCVSGCASWPLSSKWAMKNPDYAAKYDRPYPKREAKRYARMAKQIVDARHVEGMSGTYVGAAAQGNPFALGLELGGTEHPTSWLETRASLAGVIAHHDIKESDKLGQNAFLGLNAGARVNSPTRIAPFAGVGTYGGMSWFIREAENDGVDNDDDLLVDEPGETKWGHDFLMAVYPEVGLHFWLRHNRRITASAAYYMTTQGRDDDFWLFGISIGRFDEPRFSGKTSSHDEEPVDWAPPEPARAAVSRLPTP